jgi:hypothetical protein
MEDFTVDEVVSRKFSDAQVEYGFLNFSYLERLDRDGGQSRICELLTVCVHKILYLRNS